MTKRLINLLVCLFLAGLGTLALAQTSVEVRVAQSSDDAEEFTSESSVGPAGTVYLDSSDLELVEDDDAFQVVGIRFAGVEVPQGATITRAYVQFTVDEATDTPTEVTVQGEAGDNAETFSDTEEGISSRPLTSASVTWSPAPWTEGGASGAEQQTNDLAPVIQEIVTQSGWQSGNALAIIMQGSGKRTAESFDGNQGNAPLLYVEYQAEAETMAETGGEEAETTSTETGGAETGDAETAEMTDTETGGAETGQAGAETGGEETDEMGDAETGEETEMTESEVETETEMTETTPSTPVPALSNSALVREQRYSLSSAGDSSVNGTLLIGDYNTGSLIMTVFLNRQPADATYSLDLYRGTCGDDATEDRLVDLNPVEGERGSISVTTLPLTFESLEEADLYLNVYDSEDSSGNVVACGEVGVGAQ